jgi:integrase
MAWKATGRPLVRQQRGRWVVRVDGIETTTGKARPRQLGTYPSRRAAQRSATEAAATDAGPIARGTVGWLVRRWVASKTDVSVKSRQQYEWAAGHIERGLGAVRLDRLDRDDIAAWLEELASGGALSRRSIQIFRTVLRAALAEATEEGLLRRNPALRVGMPREVVKAGLQRETETWDEEQVAAFLDAASAHRLGAPIRLETLYGLRRSELLALRWSDLDFKVRSVVVDEGLVEVKGGVVWTPGKSVRSRRTIPVDAETMRSLAAHRKAQIAERLAVGAEWVDLDLVVTTRTGNYVEPRNFDAILERLIARAGVPRLTSHGLRHTAATLMVRHAADVGELRAIADILGHSPDMLMKVYAHTLPESLRSVADKIGNRARD